MTSSARSAMTAPMHLPGKERIEDSRTLLALMREHSFATLAVYGGAPSLDHLPVLIDADAAGRPTRIRAHVSRSNPVWRSLDGRVPACFAFLGPHGYLSPSWYGPGEWVPTWNYVTAHAWGSPRVVEDPAELARSLEDLVAFHEAGFPNPWREALSPETRAELHRAIVAIEMPIERLEGKLKLSQSRSEGDRRGAIAGLRARGGDRYRELADWMERVLDR